MITDETRYIENLFATLGRAYKQNILKESNLNDRELDLLEKRFVNGLSLKECSELFGLEINTISKNQLKATKKLYHFLVN